MRPVEGSYEFLILPCYGTCEDPVFYPFSSGTMAQVLSVELSTTCGNSEAGGGEKVSGQDSAPGNLKRCGALCFVFFFFLLLRFVCLSYYFCFCFGVHGDKW